MSTVRYSVHYDVGTYSGDVQVYADENAEPEYVIARAKRQVYAGTRPPLGLYSEDWRITDVHEVDDNPRKKKKVRRPKTRLTDEDLEVLRSLEQAVVDFWDLPSEEQTRQYYESDGAEYKAAKRMVKQGYAEEMQSGSHRGDPWVIVRLTDKGHLALRRRKNPAELGRPQDDVVVVAVRGPGGREVHKVVRGVEFVDGVFAIHPSMRNLREIEEGTRDKPSSWGISHVPTGQLVATLGSKEWARKLAREIVGFSGDGIHSMDVQEAVYGIAGPGLARAPYILHVQRQSQETPRERGAFPTYAGWREYAGELEANPANLKSDAAVAAAVGTLVGGVLGAVGGAVILGAVGGVLGGAVAGGAGVGGGAAVGAVWGLPIGATVGSIWGAVRQTGRALEGYDAQTAKILAGLGAAVFGPLAPIGAGVGAYLGAPD